MSGALKSAARNLRVRISAGPNQGLQWSIATGTRYLKGKFEAERAATLQSLVEPGDVVWDIGAHRGYMTLVAARSAGPSGEVYAFEPSAESRWFLENHIRWNRLANTRVFSCAISNFDGESSLGGGSSLARRLVSRGANAVWMDRLGEPESANIEQVEVRSMTSLIKNDGCKPPTVLKINAEGAEADILEASADYLGSSKMAIMLSTHSEEIHQRCLGLLEAKGYRVYESADAALAKEKGWEAAGEVGMLAVGADRHISLQELGRYTSV